MRYTWLQRTSYLVVLVVLLVHVAGVRALAVSDDPLHEINIVFVNSISVETNGKYSIEFCPDNTCILFISGKLVPLDILKDFAYLYIYFFSTYYVLDEWRTQKEPSLVTRQILSKESYLRCKNDDEKQAARCLMSDWSRTDGVELYAVRYDENVRSVYKLDIDEALGEAPRPRGAERGTVGK